MAEAVGSREDHSDNFGKIFYRKASLGKYLKEKCSAEHFQQLSFKYFVIFFLMPESLLKVSLINMTISRELLDMDGLYLPAQFLHWQCSQFAEQT